MKVSEVITELMRSDPAPRSFHSLTLDELLKHVGGPEALEKEAQHADEALDILLKAAFELTDHYHQNGVHEVEQVDPAEIFDYVDDHFEQGPLSVDFESLVDNLIEQDPGLDQVDFGGLATDKCTVNEHGDLVCPHCGTTIMTPIGYDIAAGFGTCPGCKQNFSVTQRLAFDANQRSRK